MRSSSARVRAVARPSSEVYSASARTSTSSTSRPALPQPRREVGEVGAVRAPRRRRRAPGSRGTARSQRSNPRLPCSPRFAPRLPCAHSSPSSSSPLSQSAPTTYIAMDDDDVQPAATGSVTLVGDSLNVGIDPYLREELDGWTVDAHDRVGRSTDEGVDGASAAPVERSRRSSSSASGRTTPTAPSTSSDALVSEAVGVVGPSRCLLWATIVRGRRAAHRVQRRARGSARRREPQCPPRRMGAHSSRRTIACSRATPSTARPTGYAAPGRGDGARAVRACPARAEACCSTGSCARPCRRSCASRGGCGSRVPGTFRAGASIVVVNHDSMADPFVVGAAIDRPLRYLAKSELWRNPLIRRAIVEPRRDSRHAGTGRRRPRSRRRRGPSTRATSS